MSVIGPKSDAKRNDPFASKNVEKGTLPNSTFARFFQNVKVSGSEVNDEMVAVALRA